MATRVHLSCDESIFRRLPSLAQAKKKKKKNGVNIESEVADVHSITIPLGLIIITDTDVMTWNGSLVVEVQ